MTTITEKIFQLISILIAIFICHAPVEAKTLVTGQYSSSSGKHIVLNMQISSPAPANLIVEQNISPQNVIISSSPRAKKSSRGKLKWLFRNTDHGQFSISIKLQSPLQGRINAVVRYRDPDSGNFIESQISP